MRHKITEQALDRHGLAYTYVTDTAVESVSLEKGIKNQARLSKPLDTDVRDRYAEFMKEYQQQEGGVVAHWPAPVVAKPAGSRVLVPVDGNHGLAARVKIGEKRTDAYVLETTDQFLIDRITLTINGAVNGLPNTHEENLQHALMFVRKWKMSSREAAKLTGVHQTTVMLHVRAQEVRDIAEAAGVKVPRHVPTTVLGDLAALKASGSDVLVEAVQTTVKNGLGVTEVAELVVKVKDCSRAADRIQAVIDYGDSETAKRRRAESMGGKIARPRPLPSSQYRKILQDYVNLRSKFIDAKALRLGGAEGRELRKVAQLVHDDLAEVFGFGVVAREAAS